MTQTQTRMSPLILIRSRTSPVLHEEERQVPSGLGEVLGIHRTQRLVSLNRVVKSVHEMHKKGFTADVFEERFFHSDTLIVSPTLVLLVFDRRAGVAQW